MVATAQTDGFERHTLPITPNCRPFTRRPSDDVCLQFVVATDNGCIGWSHFNSERGISMDSSNSSSAAASPRAILTLKVGARKSADKGRTAPWQPPSKNKSNVKPGARWSDEYKERMQSDMNALHSE